MPKFLEDKLKKDYSKKGLKGKELDHAVFGTLNTLGAVRGNQETEKGKAMEVKHQQDAVALAKRRK